MPAAHTATVTSIQMMFFGKHNKPIFIEIIIFSFNPRLLHFSTPLVTAYPNLCQAKSLEV